MTAFAVDNGLPYLALSVASQTYAVSATSVMEIVSLQPLTPLPTMPACVLGLMNLRGTVIPVIDLGEKLGFGPTAIGPRTSGSRKRWLRWSGSRWRSSRPRGSRRSLPIPQPIESSRPFQLAKPTSSSRATATCYVWSAGAASRSCGLPSWWPSWRDHSPGSTVGSQGPSARMAGRGGGAKTTMTQPNVNYPWPDLFSPFNTNFLDK